VDLSLLNALECRWQASAYQTESSFVRLFVTRWVCGCVSVHTYHKFLSTILHDTSYSLQTIIILDCICIFSVTLLSVISSRNYCLSLCSSIMTKASAPLISSAGRNHVLLSKQFAIVLGTCSLESRSAFGHQLSQQNVFGVVVLLVCGGIIFFRMERNAVIRSRLDDEHVRNHNQDLKSKNEELKAAKTQLLQDEEE
jgi:hypothetical protein